MTADIKLTTGQRVKIVKRDLTYDAVVIKTGRLWCELQRLGWEHIERFRMDTRTPHAPGKGYGSPPHFYTLEEWDERGRAVADEHFLRKQGVRLNIGTNTPWTRSTLADALRLAQSIGNPRELLGLIEDYGQLMHEVGRGMNTTEESAAKLAEIEKRLGITDAE